MTALAAGAGSPWADVAHVGALDADARAAFEAAVLGSPLAPGGRVVVTTCHRVEVYGIGPRPAWPVPAMVERGLARLDGDAAAAHAFRLAAGLESTVLGEDQILAQVREALRAAQADGALDPRLNRLFQDAVKVGRRARTAARPQARDLAEPVLDILAGVIGELAGRRMLVVGSGRMGTTAARAAVVRGARVVVAGRTPARVARVAARLGVPGLDLATAARVGLGDADAVIVALAGPWRELDEMAPTGELPTIVDLSAPTALSASVRLRLGSRFTGIDDLARITERRSATADAFVQNAETLVADAARDYARWLAGRRAAAAIRTLQDRADRAREREVARLFRQIPDLGDRERELVAALARRLTGSILHPALVSLRRGADDPDAIDGPWSA